MSSSPLGCDFVTSLIERLRNENEDKTKTQITQSFNQNETKIWRPKYPKSIQSCVFVSPAFWFRNLSNESKTAKQKKDELNKFKRNSKTEVHLAEFRHNRILQSPDENYFNVCRQHKEK